MASGIQTHGDCLAAVESIKLRKESKYIVFTISKDKSEIIIEKIQPASVEANETNVDNSGAAAIVARPKFGSKAIDSKSEKELYEKFVEELPKNDCRWIVYDFQYEKEGGIREKLIFISWSPDAAHITQKMLFASSKDNFIKSLTGIAALIQATDFDEVSYKTVFEKVDLFAAKAAEAKAR